MATTVAPYTDAAVILAGSRSDGTNTTARSPACAACADTAWARFPVDAHATVSNPNSQALVSATDTTRSLKECVGLRVSSLIHRSRRPSSAPRRAARRSGLHPSPRSTRSSRAAGSRASYRHSERGPSSADGRDTSAATRSRSYTGSSGPKHSSHAERGSAGQLAPHSLHASPVRYLDTRRSSPRKHKGPPTWRASHPDPPSSVHGSPWQELA